MLIHYLADPVVTVVSFAGLVAAKPSTGTPMKIDAIEIAKIEIFLFI